MSFAGQRIPYYCMFDLISGPLLHVWLSQDPSYQFFLLQRLLFIISEFLSYYSYQGYCFIARCTFLYDSPLMHMVVPCLFSLLACMTFSHVFNTCPPTLWLPFCLTVILMYMTVLRMGRTSLFWFHHFWTFIMASDRYCHSGTTGVLTGTPNLTVGSLCVGTIPSQVALLSKLEILKINGNTSLDNSINKPFRDKPLSHGPAFTELPLSLRLGFSNDQAYSFFL